MTAARKMKISVTLDADLLRAVDERAASEGVSRSAVMERWLRQARSRSQLARLEEETAAYYDALTAAERSEDAALAAAATRAARHLSIDDDAASVARHSRSRPRRRG